MTCQVQCQYKKAVLSKNGTKHKAPNGGVVVTPIFDLIFPSLADSDLSDKSLKFISFFFLIEKKSAYLLL